MKNIMTTISEQKHLVLTQMATKDHQSLREYMRGILGDHVDQQKLLAKVIKYVTLDDGPISRYYLSLIVNPALAMGVGPQKIMADLSKQGYDANYTPQELALMTWALTYVQQRYLYQQLDLDCYDFMDEYEPTVSEQSKATIENQLSKPAEIVDVPWGRDLCLRDNNNQKVDWRLFDRNVLFERGSSKAVDNQLKDDLKIVRDYYGIKSINLVEPSLVLMGIDFEHKRKYSDWDALQSPIHDVDMSLSYNRDQISMMKQAMEHNSDNYVHGTLSDGTHIKFKDHYMDHSFTNQEVQDLLHGRVIKIKVTTKKKAKYQVPGKLARQSFVGRNNNKITYWGFQPDWRNAVTISLDEEKDGDND